MDWDSPKKKNYGKYRLVWSMNTVLQVKYSKLFRVSFERQLMTGCQGMCFVNLDLHKDLSLTNLCLYNDIDVTPQFLFVNPSCAISKTFLYALKRVSITLIILIFLDVRSSPVQTWVFPFLKTGEHRNCRTNLVRRLTRILCRSVVSDV